MKPLLIATEPIDYSIAFANGLAQHLAPTVIAPARHYRSLAGWFDPAVTLRLVDWPRTRSAANLAFLWRLLQMVRGERPDLVHLLSNTALWLNAAAPLWRSLPLVTTVHDVTVHPGDSETARLPDWPARLIARQSRDLVVHGASLKQAAAARFGKPERNVHVLQHPAIRRYTDLGAREGLQRSSPTSEFRVLMFGRIYAYKGLRTLVRAEALLANRLPRLRIVIAGRGDDPLQLRGEMGVPERYDVRRRFIDDREVAQLFLDADVVALPYDEASQSGVLHLAAAFGKPVVVTDVGELAATVEPNRIGLIVPPGRPDCFGEAIARLAEDRHLLETLGENARAWSEGPNAPATVGAAAAALYRQLTAL
ncbi:glycosyl transferase [Acuticoccus sediminis]|uniref:Glycosyl transferase n=1 Tax=Acuticoccus sediminis TaxID=2184697 RepID=A0A8B2NGE8_9HYPH|nr:glycosyltransferase [Acuticoccus sediminis]RAH98330.1 glycosyl transferase [Acuticoccus sediminis]